MKKQNYGKIKYRMLAAALSLAMLFGLFVQQSPFGLTAHATTIQEQQQQVDETQEKIDEQQEKIDEQENEIGHTQQEINEIEGSKKTLEDQLDELVEKYNSIEEEIAALEEQMAAKQEEIAQTEEDLLAAQAVADGQYADMKMRIQYMYEYSDENFFTLFFEERSFSKALTRALNIASLTAYDQEKMAEYVAVQDEIAAQKSMLEAEKADLDEMLAAIIEKQQEIEDMQNSTEGELQRRLLELLNKKNELGEMEEDLEELNKILDELMDEKEKLEKSIEAAKLAEIKASLGNVTGTQVSGTENANYGGYGASEDDVVKLAVLCYCEAGNQGYVGQLAVASVVMNRIRDPRFKQNTIESVIRAPGQFAPVTSGRYDLVLTQRLSIVTDSCYQAARAAIAGTSNVGNRVFFRTWAGHPELSGLVIGAHIFSYYWNYPPENGTVGTTTGSNATTGGTTGGGSTSGGTTGGSSTGGSTTGGSTSGGTTDPGTGSTTDPGAGGTTDPGTGGTTDSGAGGTTDPGAGGTTDPGAGGTTDPGAGGTTDPGTGGTTDPGAGGTTDPGTGGEPDPASADPAE